VHLVGFIIGIYHDAGSSECPIPIVKPFCNSGCVADTCLNWNPFLSGIFIYLNYFGL